MKTSAKSLLIVSALATITIFSCKKERTILPESPGGNTNSLSALFSEKAAPKQIFTIDASQYQTITGANGTVLIIPSGSFKNMSGQTVTNGNVTIELREIYSKSDMIFSKAPTMSNKQLLVSGGEMFLQAFQNGSPLSLSSSNSVGAMVPAINPGPMREFYSDLPFSLESQGMPLELNWELSDSSYNDSIIVIEDSINNFEYPYYCFNLDGMNWINCDYFYDYTGALTDIDVNVGSQFNGSNCAVFVSFDGINSIVSLGDYDANNIFDYGWDSFPQGLGVHIIAIASINGQYYSSVTPATLGANFSTNVTLTSTTLAQITADINALP